VTAAWALVVVLAAGLAALLAVHGMAALAVWRMARQAEEARRTLERELGEVRRELAATLERLRETAGETGRAAKEIGRLAEASSTALQGAAAAAAFGRLLPGRAAWAGPLAQAALGLGTALWRGWGQRRRPREGGPPAGSEPEG
jgi:hypothetical protein